MQYEYSPMQLAEVTDFSFLKDWDTIRIIPEGYGEEVVTIEDGYGLPHLVPITEEWKEQ
jgi:hypothetical protein